VTAESALGSVTIFALVALAALVQPLNPDPNAPGVHRSVVEHTPTHRLRPETGGSTSHCIRRAVAPTGS
jgi:hypothetical protein